MDSVDCGGLLERSCRKSENRKVDVENPNPNPNPTVALVHPSIPVKNEIYATVPCCPCPFRLFRTCFQKHLKWKMARFSLSPKSFLGNQTGLSKENADSSSECSSLGEPIEDKSEDEDEEEEEEEAHPLGFSNQGSTRMGLIRGAFLGKHQTSPQIQPNSRDIYGSPIQHKMSVVEHIPNVIHYLNGHLNIKTPVLLKHHHHLCLSEKSLQNDIFYVQDHITDNLHITEPPFTLSKNKHLDHVACSKDTSFINCKSPIQAAQDLKQNERELRNDVARKRERMEQNQRLAVNSFLQLLEQDEREAARILEREHQRLKEQEYILAEEEKKQEDHRLVELSKVKERQRMEYEKRTREENELRLQREEEERERLEDMKKNEYITVAYNMVDSVKKLREQLEIFEMNPDKGVSKRRLEMKKIARGKLNTLSHDQDKIISVAQDVVRAVQSVIQEDAEIRQRLSSMGGGLQTANDTVSVLGASYFMDLIASNVIVRIQAEGFNGYVYDMLLLST